MVTIRNFPIQGVKITGNPMFKSVQNDVRSKEASSNFLPLNYSGEVAKLT